MKPYLKGFHLTLEMWRGNRNSDGWKEKPPPPQKKAGKGAGHDEHESLEDIKLGLLADSLCEEEDTHTNGPSSGLKPVVPRFKSDLEAILHFCRWRKIAVALCEEQTHHDGLLWFW